MFGQIYNKKKVLITGHTGFKGSWLSIWLKQLGAEVIGVSIEPPSIPNIFEVTNLKEKIIDLRINICSLKSLQNIIDNENPDFIFHLAAQPLVKESYVKPCDTFETNILGTANILEAVRKVNKKCILILITSDKCYLNKEWDWGYRENDELGGKDPYSASKACAELIIKSMFNSYFENNEHIFIATARAGNVIGGGDWAPNRIVPDSIKAWKKKEKVLVRSPNSTRPWQHVLEPLSGYLLLGQALWNNKIKSGNAFNFGPKSDQIKTVIELLNGLSKNWNDKKNQTDLIDISVNLGEIPQEAGLLKLNCDKVLSKITWKPVLEFEETIKLTTNWYKEYYLRKNRNMFDYSLDQIKYYTELANSRNITWAK